MLQIDANVLYRTFASICNIKFFLKYFNLNRCKTLKNLQIKTFDKP